MSTHNADAIDAAMQRRPQKALALELDWPESKVSEFKTKLKQDGSLFLAALGLKVVPVELECYDARKVDVIVEALKVAAQSLTSQQLRSEN